MARNQFRVDLGYEEMGLSSHLFVDEFTGGFNSLRRNHRDPYGSGVVDTLSDQFSSLSLLRPKPRTIPPLPSSLQLFRPQDLSSANHISNGGPKADQRLYKLYELHLSRLRQNESQQDRARVLQRQEARLHKGDLAHRNVNVLKESVGTGVFHPLQRPTSQPVTSIKKHNQMNRNQSEKELMTKERRGVMAAGQQQQQQDECHYHLPWDMDFSKDWTF